MPLHHTKDLPQGDGHGKCGHRWKHGAGSLNDSRHAYPHGRSSVVQAQQEMNATSLALELAMDWDLLYFSISLKAAEMENCGTYYYCGIT